MNRAPAPWGIFVGCVVLGVGIGMLFDRTGAGAVIGVGVGFLLAAVLGGFRK